MSTLRLCSPNDLFKSKQSLSYKSTFCKLEVYTYKYNIPLIYLYWLVTTALWLFFRRLPKSTSLKNLFRSHSNAVVLWVQVWVWGARSSYQQVDQPIDRSIDQGPNHAADGLFDLIGWIVPKYHGRWVVGLIERLTDQRNPTIVVRMQMT